MTTRNRTCGCAVLPTLVSGILGLVAATAVPAHALEPEAVIGAGRIEYRKSCAGCHGEDGSGDGPIATVLLTAPRDLTQLKADNNGVFPWDYVYDAIDGRVGTHAHGRRAMPVWGDRYQVDALARRQKGQGYFDERAMVFGRINALTAYIESIQD